MRPCLAPLIITLLYRGEVMTWHLGWQVAVVWLLAVAFASVIYFVPMTRFIDNLSDRSAVIADAE
jgi:hypothetical protein